MEIAPILKLECREFAVKKLGRCTLSDLSINGPSSSTHQFGFNLGVN